MRQEDFTENASGELVTAPRGGLAFVPFPLPPQIELSWELVDQIASASRALSELSGVARNLPNDHLLISPFIRREALLSSQIEGTQTSLSELFFFEAASDEPPNADIEEVVNYINALEYGLSLLPEREISLSFLREMHHLLLKGVRGQNKSPGEFRQDQNWIAPYGTPLDRATYVPPPPLQMQDALLSLEKYINSTDHLYPLIRIALVHYQFEAIHPFEDGNGRIGRLLITLMLCKTGLLSRPLLYLSAYLERHKETYMGCLLGISQRGEWSGWLHFFLQGVIEQAQDGVKRTDLLLALWRNYREQIRELGTGNVAYELIDALFANPAITATHIVQTMKVTPRTAQANIEKLVTLGILTEVTGRKRNRLYVAHEILRIVEALLI